MKKGFTIIEISIAMAVMAVGLVGIYALVPRVIKTISLNKDRFIASQLAAEGLELVRNKRDSNWLEQSVASTTPWNSGLTSCSSGCEADYDDLSFTSYQGRLLKLDSNGFYNYESGEETKFRRKITINAEEEDVLSVKAEVFLPTGGSFSLEEKLYNWR